MSINNILALFKKYWSAFLLGTVFLILGIVTIIALLIYIPNIVHTHGAYVIIIIGMVLGVLEIVEGVRLLYIPFRNK